MTDITHDPDDHNNDSECVFIPQVPPDVYLKSWLHMNWGKVNDRPTIFKMGVGENTVCGHYNLIMAITTVEGQTLFMSSPRLCFTDEEKAMDTAYKWTSLMDGIAADVGLDTITLGMN